MVIDALKDVDPDRRCFRMVGGVLAERTVKDVLPALHHTLEQVCTFNDNNYIRVLLYHNMMSLFCTGSYVLICHIPFLVSKEYMPEFLISSYGAPLAQRASYLALHSSLFGTVAQLIMIILSLTALTLC